jgi:hypothetical protein
MMRSETERRDWLLTGLSLVAAVVVFIAVDKAIDFSATAAPATPIYMAKQ